MSASNLTNKLKVFAEETINILEAEVFSNSDERKEGYQQNSVIRSKITNTALRQTSLVTVALIEALKELSVSNLVSSIIFDSHTTVGDAKNAIIDALTKTKVNIAKVAEDLSVGISSNEQSIDQSSNVVPNGNAVYQFVMPHFINTNNPHGVTKEQVGLDKVENYKQLRDSNKVTTISSSSTNTHIPSAKAVYDNTSRKLTLIETYTASSKITTKSKFDNYNTIIIEIGLTEDEYHIQFSTTLTIPAIEGSNTSAPLLAMLKDGSYGLKDNGIFGIVLASFGSGGLNINILNNAGTPISKLVKIYGI